MRIARASSEVSSSALARHASNFLPSYGWLESLYESLKIEINLTNWKGSPVHRICVVLFLLAVSIKPADSFAQPPQFRSRTNSAVQPASGVRPAANYQATSQSSGSVSQDLLNVYNQTRSANTEQDVTNIARQCAKVISATTRSKLDKDYAASLLAWALNRRGEMRSDRAAKLVQQDRLDEADKLDNQASEDFETAIKYAPNNWRTRHNFAIALAMSGDYRRGISEFTKAINLKPDYANAHFNRAELFFELEEYAKAHDDYSKAIQLNPNDAQYFNSRGHCAFMIEDFDSAIADYTTSSEMATDNAVYRTDLADAYHFMGEWEEAAREYRAAIGVDSEYGRAYQNAAWLMATCPDASIRNAQLALSAAQKAQQLNATRTARGFDTLAAARASLGQHSEAAKLQREALKLAGDAEEKQELSRRLKLYENGRSFRQAPTRMQRDRVASIADDSPATLR